MIKNIFILIIFFYILALFQTSFLIHFNIFLGWLGILISVILINIFENSKKNSGIFAAFFAGFFLDIFSENFIGFWILILLALSCFIKFVLKKYVRIPALKRLQPTHHPSMKL